MNTEAYEQHFRARVEQVIGPTRAERQPHMADAHWLAGLYRLQPVWLGLRYGQGRLIGYYVAVSLKERAIDCRISHRRRRSDDDLPCVKTGDHSFDQAFLVDGQPPEVVRAVLNKDTRRWMQMVFNEMAPQFDSRDGQLRLYSALVHGRDPLRAETKPIPDPAELARRIEVSLSLAERMSAAYDHHFRLALDKQRARLDARDERTARRAERKKQAKIDDDKRKKLYTRYLIACVVVGVLTGLVLALLR